MKPFSKTEQDPGGVYALPLWVADIAYYRTSDREGFVDVPFVPIMAGGFWLWVVVAIAWRLRRFRKQGAGASVIAPFPEWEFRADF